MAAIEWASDKSGFWKTAADWSGGIAPGAKDDVTIDVAGTFTVSILASVAAHSLTLDNATATISDTGTLSLGSTLSLTAGTFELNGGEISGGTLSATGGVFQFDDATLDGVTFDGPLNLSQVSSVHITSKGLIATGADGTGGTIDVGYGSNVYFQNTQTFDDATINLSGGVGGYGIHQQDTTGKGATLTLGVNLTVDLSTASYGQGYTGIFGGTYARDAIVNDGVIDVSTRDGRFSIDARTFTNAGTIDIGGGAVVIFSDRLTTSQLGRVDVVTYGGYLDFAGTLNNNGATLTVTAGEGVEGVIKGGTIAGTIGQNGLTLTGVAVEGAVVGAVTIAGGLTMTGAGGTGAGVIDGRAITFRNTQTVDGAMIDLEGLITQEDTTRKGATLTLGSDVTIALIGNAGIYGGAYAGDAIVNDGVIDVSAHQLTIAALTFTNPGAIDLANGGEVTFKDDLTTAQLGKIEVGAGGGALDFVGTLENTGATLTVAAGEVLEGLINGGTIVGTITGPTDQGRDDLTIAGGLEMAGSGGTGRGTIDVSDSFTPIFFQDTETIDNAVINLTGEATIVQRDTTGKGAILTLGGNLTIDQLSTGGAGGSGLFGGAYAGDAIVNDGVISAQSSGLFNIDALTFINAGTIEVSHRAQVIFQHGLTTAQLGKVSASTGGGELGFDGTLDNTGATLTVAAGEALAGVIDGGTIAGTITMGGNAATLGLTLDGATVEGAIDLHASYAGLTLADGSRVTGVGGTGPGRINVSGKQSSIFFQNTETIDNATINLSGDPSRSRYGYGIWQLDTVGSGVTLTLGADLTINQTHSGYTGIYGNNVAGGAIVNDGVINVSVQGGHFDIAPITFTNMGVIKVSNGGTVDIDPTELGNLSSGTLSGGRFEVDAGSMLELAVGQTVTTDDATIILSGAGSIFQGQATIDATLATIGASGTLEILAGRDWSSKVTLTNAGTLDLGGGTFAPASLNDTGLLSGHGEIDAQVTDAGAIVAAAGALELTEAVIGAGALRINAAGMLQIDASAATTLTVSFDGAGGVLALASPSAFTAAIAAFGSGDTIDLLRITATSAMLEAGDKLVVTNGAQSVATLQLRGNYVGDSFAVAADGHGGSRITVVTTASAVEPPVARFVQAISALGAGAASHVASDADARHPRPTLLSGPHAAMLASPHATTA